MTSLNPVYRIGFQIVEAIRRARIDLEETGQAARDRSAEARLGVPNATERIDTYPHRAVRRHAPAGHDRA